jgi:hypothetical protein
MAKILQDAQKKALKLHSKGMGPWEIAKKTNSYALDSGLNNLEECVKVIEWATKENVFFRTQISRLKKIFRE